MDERLRFVARLLEGEKMAPLCAEFGLSRKTGYKIFNQVPHGFGDEASSSLYFGPKIHDLRGRPPVRHRTVRSHSSRLVRRTARCAAMEDAR
jgi:hypothetical protein